MACEFPLAEYKERLAKVRQELNKRGISLLVVVDPAHLVYLSGFDSWSYQNTQALLVTAAETEPVWIGRRVDGGSAHDTTWLQPENIVTYADHYSDSHTLHGMEAVAQEIDKRGWNKGVIGYEGEAYYFTPRAFFALQKGLGGTKLVDVGLLVNEIKTVKSSAEIAYMRRAGKIVDQVMRIAVDGLRPGIRENDLAARISHAQIEGIGDDCGDWPCAPPLVLTGEHAGLPHAPWTTRLVPAGSATSLELSGCYRRYSATLARTVSLGRPSEALSRLAGTVHEGMEAALSTIRAGVTCHDVWAAWQRVLARDGYEKHSRIGYSLGVNYHPTWRDHTASLRSGETVVLEPGMCFHVLFGMWTGDGHRDENYEISETVAVTETGYELMTHFERNLIVKA